MVPSVPDGYEIQQKKKSRSDQKDNRTDIEISDQSCCFICYFFIFFCSTKIVISVVRVVHTTCIYIQVNLWSTKLGHEK